MGEAARRQANGHDPHKAAAEQQRAAQEAAQRAELERLPPFVQQLLTTHTDPMALLEAKVPIETAEQLARLEVSGRSMKGRLNIYTCRTCRGHVVTRDIDTGVTPFLTSCAATEGCGGMMQSSMYNVFDQAMRASHIWYRPHINTLLSPATIEHLNKGGLILRRAGETEEV